MIKKILLIVCCLFAHWVAAEINLGPLFTDNMVLQRDKPVVIWGTAEQGETVTVEFAGQAKSGVTGADGKWQVTLDPMPASSEPRKMIISSNSNTPTLQYSNLLVGEVWFAGGQSNMRFGLWSTDGAAELFASGGAEVDGIRLFAMPEIVNELDMDLPIKGWQACTKESSTAFSAVAWYFGRALKEHFGDVPVGLIMSARGGTPGEAWMDPEFSADCKPFREYADSIDTEYRAKFSDFEEYKRVYIQYRRDLNDFVQKKSPKKPEEPKGPWWSQRAGGFYSTMIAPILPYTVRGILWYQGETNIWRAYDYRYVLEMLIHNWRRDFNDGTLPFLVVQLPGFGNNDTHPVLAVVRDSQTVVAANDSNVGLIPIPELGDEKDIHPRNKRPVGERLARFARGFVYGENIQYASPSLDSAEFVDGKAVVLLKDADGLVQQGDAIHGFTIAGADQIFFSATVELNGGQLIVSSPEVKDPVAVRYLWTNWIDPAKVNLFNGAGLPLAPFRTDEFSVVTQK
jgi:sialate O-acetylesterase